MFYWDSEHNLPPVLAELEQVGPQVEGLNSGAAGGVPKKRGSEVRQQPPGPSDASTALVPQPCRGLTGTVSPLLVIGETARG